MSIMPKINQLLPSLLLAAFITIAWPCFATENTNTAPVSGFARAFVLGNALSNATITILETGEKIKTDKEGHFGPISYPIGKPITLVFEKFGYKTTQSATVMVPREGLTGPYNNITFQVPSLETYYLLSSIIGAKVDDKACHVVVTVTAFQKTMDDIPQGEVNAKLTLIPETNQTAF